eukprot:1384900-Amorphochlora_amoeboformis.AAC.1
MDSLDCKPRETGDSPPSDIANVTLQRDLSDHTLQVLISHTSLVIVTHLRDTFGRGPVELCFEGCGRSWSL